LIALIGPTASGKSDLAIGFALKNGYEILSLDSLSIYKEIDIASAKPSKEELNKVKHYGVNKIYRDLSKNKR
jgi:tRNA dimethylallyltransferase